MEELVVSICGVAVLVTVFAWLYILTDGFAGSASSRLELKDLTRENVARVKCSHPHPIYPNLLVGHVNTLPCREVLNFFEDITLIWEELHKIPKFAGFHRHNVWIQFVQDRRFRDFGVGGVRWRVFALVNYRGKSRLKVADTLAEELYHVLQGYLGEFYKCAPTTGELLREAQRYYPETPGALLHYVLNEFEYEAGSFAHRLFMCPSDVAFWASVEKYRQDHGLS